MPEIAHADKRNNGADQGQPLQSGGDLRVSRQAQVSRQTNDPHEGAAPESHYQPTHSRSIRWCCVIVGECAPAITAAFAMSQYLGLSAAIALQGSPKLNNPRCIPYMTG